MKTFSNFCDTLSEKWSQKYKSSIDCSHPKGFSQKAHCQGRKKKSGVSEANNLDLADLDEPFVSKRKTPKDKYKDQRSDSDQYSKELRVQR